MYDRLTSERNFSPLLNEEFVAPIEPNSPEMADLQFHFNTIFNDVTKRNYNEKIHEIEKGFSLKNQYIALNFEKRETNEISAYGWYFSKINEDKKIEELVINLRTKGLSKVEHEINVSAPLTIEENQIIICKFIVGESEVIFQDGELTDEEKNE